MTVNIENYIPVVAIHGLNTEKNAVLAGTNTLSGATTISGATTLSGTTTVSGAASFTGGTAGVTSPVTAGTDATYTLTAAMSGATFFATKSSATQTYTLPAVAAGLKFTFICGHASGEILIDQASSEVITITTFAAVGADADR